MLDESQQCCNSSVKAHVCCKFCCKFKTRINPFYLSHLLLPVITVQGVRYKYSYLYWKTVYDRTSSQAVSQLRLSTVVFLATTAKL